MKMLDFEDKFCSMCLRRTCSMSAREFHTNPPSVCMRYRKMALLVFIPAMILHAGCDGAHVSAPSTPPPLSNATMEMDCDPRYGDWECEKLNDDEISQLRMAIEMWINLGDYTCWDVLGQIEESIQANEVYKLPSGYFYTGYSAQGVRMALNEALFTDERYARQLAETAIHESGHNMYWSYNTEHLAEMTALTCTK